MMQSCVVYNSVKFQENTICELHNEEMKKALVGTFYGKGCSGNKVYYPNAKSKKCMGCIVKLWTNRRLAYIYHCKSCNKLKKSDQFKNEKPF